MKHIQVKWILLHYNSIKKPEYSRSRRIKIGLYKNYVGQLINADINGTINILWKVVGDSVLELITDRGLVNRPNRLRLAFEPTKLNCYLRRAGKPYSFNVL